MEVFAYQLKYGGVGGGLVQKQQIDASYRILGMKSDFSSEF